LNGRGFFGSGVKFPLQIDTKTGRLAIVSGEEDIAEAIRIIIGTYKGERVMRPGFGTNIRDYIFAPAGSLLYETIKTELVEQLLLQEPRIRDVTIDILTNSAAGELRIDIGYTVRSTNNRYNKVYPFFTEEAQ
jgi:phage baseplate assembly protein W